MEFPIAILEGFNTLISQDAYDYMESIVSREYILQYVTALIITNIYKEDEIEKNIGMNLISILITLRHAKMIPFLLGKCFLTYKFWLYSEWVKKIWCKI